LAEELAGSVATLPGGGPGSEVGGAPAAADPVGDEPAALADPPAEMDGAVDGRVPLAPAGRPGAAPDVPGPPGAPVAPGGRAAGGAPDAEVRGGAGGCTVGLGAGFVVGFGTGGGAGAAGGAIPGGAPAPKAHPSTDPGAGSCPAAPSELYAHEPPRDACQYDQYAVVGGVRTHGSDAGAPLIRQTNPGPSC
jgi:hypothetical protein